MNLLLLAIAFRAWSGSAQAMFLRLMAAIAVFSLEVQVATWTHLATLRSLRLLNLVIAAAAAAAVAARRARRHADPDAAVPVPAALPAAPARVPPWAAVLALAAVVTTLAVTLPVKGADPYHLHRVDQITSRGTLAYDPAAPDIKVNALAGVYELLLADLRIPGMSTALVRLHGLFGLGLYLLAVAAVASWAPVPRRWTLATYLVIPVVFHQLVLVKNDLFGALPAFVALAWVVARGGDMRRIDIAAAGALAGLAVGIKISSAPIALVVAGFVAVDHRGRWRALAPVLAGGIAGAVAGGLLFALIENQLVYGGALRPYLSLGNRHETLAGTLTGLWRFSLSLIDLGRITPRVWPGRGGWGSTAGLPLVWALLVLAVSWRAPLARRALIAAAVIFAVFAASYPDADLAHRMVIAPALLAIACALSLVGGNTRRMMILRGALLPVLALSALQIGRSALIYLAGR